MTLLLSFIYIWWNLLLIGVMHMWLIPWFVLWTDLRKTTHVKVTLGQTETENRWGRGYLFPFNLGPSHTSGAWSYLFLFRSMSGVYLPFKPSHTFGLIKEMGVDSCVHSVLFVVTFNIKCMHFCPSFSSLITLCKSQTPSFETFKSSPQKIEYFVFESPQSFIHIFIYISFTRQD